ncbi:hypothetical protein PV328_001177 [Microctonus aethiopoides]|uniref:Uncharacterized protein n=1 Tax=Microctonus aethiopoides TaxID=144406 RepID=A0AA39KX17_9HYME|nr:hypothetical protein PV328_001177 [Microctonus aethiopoides]
MPNPSLSKVTTDDEELLDRTFKILEKFICHMYGVTDSSNVNDVRFHLFSNTYRSKKLDDNFNGKFRNFDSSSLPPCKAELYQHLLWVRYITMLWRNAHSKHLTSLSPDASSWTVTDNKYDFIWFVGDQLPSLVADIMNDDNTSKHDLDNKHEHESSGNDDEDYEDVSVFCDTKMD